MSPRPARTFLCLVLLLLSACDTPPPVTPQSQPLVSAQESSAPQQSRIRVPEVAGAVQDVVPVGELVARYPALGALSEAQLQQAVGALHLVPGPCRPCAGAEMHLARCSILAPSPACANVPGLVARAAAAASRSRPLNEIIETVHYPDVWTQLPPAPTGRVAVELVLAPEDPWTPEALATRRALEVKYGIGIEIRVSEPGGQIAAALEVRTTPTWAVAGYRMRGVQSAPALGRLIDRELRRSP